MCAGPEWRAVFANLSRRELKRENPDWEKIGWWDLVTQILAFTTSAPTPDIVNIPEQLCQL